MTTLRHPFVQAICPGYPLVHKSMLSATTRFLQPRKGLRFFCATYNRQCAKQATASESLEDYGGLRTPTTVRLWRMRNEAGDSERSGKFELLLPFGSNETFRAAYESFDGGMRFGKLMEDLDAASGNVAAEYCKGITPKPQIVTAVCDRIDLHRKLSKDMDVILSGQVSSVGRTSLEVCIEISTADSAKDLILECFFVMAARDKAGKGVELPKLELNADMQRKSAERKAKRKQEAHDVSETMKNGLTAAEFQLLHEYITSAGKKYKSSTPMKDTELSAVKITEPQQRNTNNRIFGGYLMREAFEVAHAVAIEFAGPSARPFCMSVDEITFIKPVEIGSLVKFKGKVVYTGISKKAMQVKVKTYIHNLNTLERYTSNEFRFTFASEVPLPTVIPSTFVEGMNFLDGRRSHRRCKQLAKEQKSALQDNY